MLYLALMTLIFFTSPLEREVDRTVDEYLSQLDLDSTRYVVVVANGELQGAVVLHWIEAGKDSAVFFFDRELLLQLSKQERRVLIAHEVGHLAPQCQLGGSRIFRELCGRQDRIPARSWGGCSSHACQVHPHVPLLSSTGRVYVPVGHDPGKETHQ